MDRQDRPNHGPEQPPDEGPDGPAHTGGRIFAIHVQGHLPADWADWLEGFEMCRLENGETRLLGPIADQSALLGVIGKLCRLNLTLLSIHTVEKKGQEIK